MQDIFSVCSSMKKFRTKRSISGNKKREVVYYKLKEASENYLED